MTRGGHRHYGWNDAFRQKVFNDYVAGTYRTNKELCAAYGIKRPGTLSRWIKRYDWDTKRKELLEQAQTNANIEIVQSLEDVNLLHIRAWRQILEQAMHHLRETRTKNGGIIPKDPDDLLKLSQVIERAQRGQRLAMGADTGEGGDVIISQVLYDGLEAEIRKAMAKAKDNGGVIDVTPKEIEGPSEEETTLDSE